MTTFEDVRTKFAEVQAKLSKLQLYSSYNMFGKYRVQRTTAFIKYYWNEEDIDNAVCLWCGVGANSYPEFDPLESILVWNGEKEYEFDNKKFIYTSNKLLAYPRFKFRWIDRELRELEVFFDSKHNVHYFGFDSEPHQWATGSRDFLDTIPKDIRGLNTFSPIMSPWGVEFKECGTLTIPWKLDRTQMIDEICKIGQIEQFIEVIKQAP